MCFFNRWALQGPLDFNRYFIQLRSIFLKMMVMMLVMVMVTSMGLQKNFQGQVKVSRVNKIQLTRINWKIKSIFYGLATRTFYFLKKYDTKWPKFPPCRNWPIWVSAEGPKCVLSTWQYLAWQCLFVCGISMRYKNCFRCMGVFGKCLKSMWVWVRSDEPYLFCRTLKDLLFHWTFHES